MKKLDAYICYSALDSSLVHEIVDELYEYKCFIPVRDIPLGSNWSTSIEKEIKAADVFVVICTHNFNNSYTVVDELYKASCYKKAIITYCVDSVTFRDDKKWLEYSHKVAFSAGDHKTLVSALDIYTDRYTVRYSPRVRIPSYETGYCSNDKPKKYTSHPRHIGKKDSLLKRLISRLLNSYQHVNSAIYAPSEVFYDEHMLVQVYIYTDGEESMVEMKAKSADYDAIIRNYEPLHMSLKRGDSIKIVYDNGFYNEVKTIIWQGTLCQTVFCFKVREDYSFCSNVKIFINDHPVGEMTFRTKVLEKPDKNLNAEIKCVRYNRIFISYAHSDASKIQYFAEAYKASGTEFFYDRYSLAPGDKYQDKIFEYIDGAELFILCWSKNSALSEWCCLEKERALYKASVNKDFKIYPVSIDPKTTLPYDISSKYHYGEI